MPGANQEQTLFELSAQVPKGCLYHPSFVSEIEERDLIETIQTLQLTPFKFHQFIGKRRTKSFGWDYEFGAGKITEAADLPEFLLPLRKRAGSHFKIPSDELVQATIIEYSPGAPIGWHRDIPQFGAVIGISLGAPCRLKLRQYRRPGLQQRERV
jgi:DNA oxidative demethylase